MRSVDFAGRFHAIPEQQPAILLAMNEALR